MQTDELNSKEITYGSNITISLQEVKYAFIYTDGFMPLNITLKQFGSSGFGDRFCEFYNCVFQIIPNLEGKFQQSILSDLIETDMMTANGRRASSHTHTLFQARLLAHAAGDHLPYFSTSLTRNQISKRS